MADQGFSFIVSNGPQVPKDPKVRTTIRKQAMRDVAVARRKRNADARAMAASNLPDDASPQDGSLVSDTGSSATASTISNSSSPDQISPESQALTILSNNLMDGDYAQWFFEDMLSSGLKIVSPVSPYEALRAEYQMDIQDLALLTGFNVSNVTIEALVDPELLRSCLGQRLYSYLAFVPSRYGSSGCITAATDCVLAKLASRLDPHNARLRLKATKLYSTALDVVQKAIGDPIEACETDTLCAVSLLSLHEVLDPGRLKAWKHHVAGSANIIRHRKATSFTSEYEKALLYSHLGPAVTQALENSTSCYLEAPEWRQLYSTFTQESTWLTARHPLTVGVRLNEVFLPGLLCEFDAAYKDRTIFDHVATADLRARTKLAHDGMLKCLNDYKAHLVATSLLSPPEDELSMRRELFGGALECLCIYKRLMGAIHESERLRYEEEAQALALLLSDLQRQSPNKNDWLFTGHEQGVARCITMCRALWEADCSQHSEEEQQALAIERWTVFADALIRWD